MNKTNIVLFTFVKSNSLIEILSCVSTYEPEKLYIVVDVARNEKELKHQLIITDIISRFREKITIELLAPEKHLGISKIFDFGLARVFEKEEEIIILEDDTIPSQSFFDFCNFALNKFKTADSIGLIMGTNLMRDNSKVGFLQSSFGFPYWGWATWKNRWNKVPNTDEFFEYQHSNNQLLNEIIQRFIRTKGLNISWDLRCCVYHYMNNINVLIPSINLVTNSGFNELATFTKNEKSVFNNLPSAINHEEVNWNINMEIINPKILEDYIKEIHFFLHESKKSTL